MERDSSDVCCVCGRAACDSEAHSAIGTHAGANQAGPRTIFCHGFEHPTSNIHIVRVCLDRNEGSPQRTLESATESQGLQQTRCVVRAEAMGCHRVHRPKDVGHWRDDVIGRREIAVAKRRAQQCSQMRQPAAVALPLPPLKQAPKQAPLPARVLPQQAVCLAEPCAPAAA